MFNDIKVDKCRLLYKKNDVSYEDRMAMSKKLKLHFPLSTICAKSGFIQQTFTPTKLVRFISDYGHNLQMPKEKQLYNALNSITLDKPQLQEKLHVTVIHVTKDIILTKPASEYIDMLANKQYSYLDTEYTISTGKPSLCLHCRKSIDSEVPCSFLIKFYDKVAEFNNQHRHYECQLYETLSKREKELLGNAYNSSKNYVDLSKLNILRIEIEFHGKEKLFPITKALSADCSLLTLPLMLESLKTETFYKTLEQVFNNTLIKYVFTADKTIETAVAELSKVRGLACKLLSESSQAKYYKPIAEEMGLLNQFSEINTVIKKIIPNSELYNELYNILFSSVNDIKESITNEINDIRSCNSYNSIEIKNLELINEVSVFDDS